MSAPSTFTRAPTPPPAVGAGSSAPRKKTVPKYIEKSDKRNRPTAQGAQNITAHIASAAIIKRARDSATTSERFPYPSNRTKEELSIREGQPVFSLVNTLSYAKGGPIKLTGSLSIVCLKQPYTTAAKQRMEIAETIGFVGLAARDAIYNPALDAQGDHTHGIAAAVGGTIGTINTGPYVIHPGVDVYLYFPTLDEIRDRGCTNSHPWLVPLSFYFNPHGGDRFNFRAAAKSVFDIDFGHGADSAEEYKAFMLIQKLRVCKALDGASPGEVFTALIAKP